MVEIAKAVGLNPEGQDGKQQMPRYMRKWRSLKYAVPSGAQAPQIEIAQVRDLIFQGCTGRFDLASTMLASHRIRLLASH
jgi:hypothetical protein